ncbi:unnamed protein product [Vicia faba]|uniref:Uncharacterized protein n=1 Tax=Vicia faba TaxID=3906 RepID=A0AAV0ZAC7_VICFA|nr:unnamed protein product [Vicia faba]
MPSMIVRASFGADSVLWLQGVIGGSVSGGRELAMAVVCWKSLALQNKWKRADKGRTVWVCFWRSHAQRWGLEQITGGVEVAWPFCGRGAQWLSCCDVVIRRCCRRLVDVQRRGDGVATVRWLSCAGDCTVDVGGLKEEGGCRWREVAYMLLNGLGMSGLEVAEKQWNRMRKEVFGFHDDDG